MICYKCKKEIEGKEIAATYLGQPMCRECANKLPKLCLLCRKHVFNSLGVYYIVKYNNKYYKMHRGCYVIFMKLEKDNISFDTCPYCKLSTNRGIFHRECFDKAKCRICNEFSFKKICEKCKTKTKKCDTCNKIVGKTEYIEINYIQKDAVMCYYCFDKYAKYSIHAWNYTFNRTFYPSKIATNTMGRGRSVLYLGTELEVECNSDSKITAFYLQDRFKTVAAKSDSSISHGFEIISYPCTLDIHKKDEWKDILEFLRKAHCLSHNTATCGMHVHINRSYFKTNANIMKLCMFIHSLRKIMIKFARRGGRQASTDYARYKKVIKKYKYQQPDYNTDHYDVVNIKPNTVELRMFKGTLKYSTFMANLEFCDALARFCIGTPINIFTKKKIMWELFLKFTEKNKQYVHLNNYIKTLNITDRDFIIKDSNQGSRYARVSTYIAPTISGGF